MELKLKPDKIETLDYLISRVFEKDQTGKPKFCFFLGAGCSAYSGIPLGWGVVERCRTIVFLNHHPQGSKVKNISYPTWKEFYTAAEKFRDERNDEYEKYILEAEKKFKAALTEIEIREIIPDGLENSPGFDINVYSEKVFSDRLYGFWLDKLDEDPRERQMFLEHIIEDIEPAGDYILFSSLVQGQVIHNVFTTNFDDLLNEALVNYYNNRSRVYAHNEMARYISPVSKRPNIIKLHGDYLYENIKNTNLETGDLEANMKTKFSEILNQMNLVVVGYGGSDHSVMSVLEMVKKDTKFCLIWCGIDPEKLNWRVVQLLNTTKNSFFVPVSDFQTLVFKLWTNADLKLPDFESDLKIKKSRLEDFLTKYKEQVKDRDEVTQKEMDILFDRTEALKWFNKAYEEKDMNKQIEFYTNSIKYNPKDHLAYYNRAFSYSEINLFDLAIEDLNIALEIDPTYANAYINRGLAYNNLKQYDKALEDYTRAIELDPDSVLAFGNRSLVNYNLKQYEKTIEDCNKAIELDPNYTNAYINRGLAHYYSKKLEQAIEDYNRAIQLNPKYAIAYVNRGLAFYDLLQNDKAIEDYNKALEIDPDYALAYGNRGLAYHELMDYEKAMEDYNKALQLDPKYTNSYINRGLAKYNLQLFAEAILDYDKAIELNPTYGLAYNNRGLAKYSLLNYEEAEKDFDKALELDPVYINAYINRGNNRFGLKYYEKAIEDYNKSLELKPDNAIAYLNRGSAYCDLKKHKESIADFLKTIELDPEYLQAYQNLSEVYIFSGQYAEAQKTIKIALKKVAVIQDKVLLHYLKFIAETMENDEAKETQDRLDQWLLEDFKSEWDITHIEDWFNTSNIPDEKLKKFQLLTEKMKGKIEK